MTDQIKNKYYDVKTKKENDIIRKEEQKEKDIEKKHK